MTSSDIVAKIRAEKNSNIDTLILEASNVEISNNIGLIIPVGTTLDRESATPRQGAIRFNSSDTAFEGYDGANWGTLGGVKDVSQTTLIRAETTPGANNKELDFITDDTQRMQIDSNGDFKFGDISNQDIKFSIDYHSGDVSAQNILPKTDMIYDLGSSNNSWDKLYIQNDSSKTNNNSGIYLEGERIIYKDNNGQLKIGSSSTPVSVRGNFDVIGSTGLGGGTAQNDAEIKGGFISNTVIGKDSSGVILRQEALFTSIDVKDNSLFRNEITIYKDKKIKFANQAGSDTTNLINGEFETIDVSTNSTFRGDLDICGELIVNNVQYAHVPAGAVMSFAMNSPPNGWLICDGSMISRTTYANLFNAIGVLHGSGNGSNTFHLPDLRDRFVRSSGNNNSFGNKIDGSTAKPTTKTFDIYATTNTVGSHNHEIRWTTGDTWYGQGTQTGIMNTSVFSGNATIYSGEGVTAGMIGNDNGSHNHTVTVTNNLNDNWDDETAPKHIVLLYCIKF